MATVAWYGRAVERVRNVHHCRKIVETHGSLFTPGWRWT